MEVHFLPQPQEFAVSKCCLSAGTPVGILPEVRLKNARPAGSWQDNGRNPNLFLEIRKAKPKFALSKKL